MKGSTSYDDTVRLIEELHQGRQFEIFTAIDGEKNSFPRCYPASLHDGVLKPTWQELEAKNDEHRGIWFTANSMMYGKRLIECINSFNAIILDLDSGKEGYNIDLIEKGKQDNLAILLDLQLPPNVIIESKNGLQPYWFLLPGEIIDNDAYKSIQKMMQVKFGADPRAIGGERLWRVPGFNHWKDVSNPFLCKIIHADYTMRYSLQELAHKFGGQRKLQEIKKKSIGKSYTGKAISIDDFKTPGNIYDIPVGCQAIARIASDKAPNHQARVALMTICANLGNYGLEYLRSVARCWNDFNPDFTEYMIQQGVNKGYRPVTCRWMVENGLCVGRCPNVGSNKSPIRFYSNPYKQVKKPFEGRTMIDPNTIPLCIEHIEVTDAIIKRLEEHGQTISDSHRAVLLNIAKVMDTPMAAKDRIVPTVIPAVPGIGKTTFLVEYLVHRLKRDENFGAVLVVERQDTIDEIVDRINSSGFNLAYGMKGYEKNYCAMGYPSYKHSQCKTCQMYECRVKQNFAMQQKYPIVVISQKRLFDMSDKDDLLGGLRFWKKMLNTLNLKECRRCYEKHARELLLIDEKPKLIENIPTDMVMWGSLIAETIQYLPDFIDEVQRAVSMVTDHYNKTIEYGRVDAVDHDFKWSDAFAEAWSELYLGDNPEYPMLLQNIIREGGLFNNNEKRTITTIHYSNVYWQDYHPFIYDGTAGIDPDYKNDQFQFVKLPDVRNYNNLYVHVCMERNLSKDFFEKNPKFVQRIADDVRKIADAGQTYVVCYKAYEEELRRNLHGSVNVSFEHYGNTRGANHLNENSAIVCIGILHKGETYYLSKNLTLNRMNLDEAHSYSVRTSDKVRRFENDDAEAIKVYEMVTELVQEIFRTQIRIHSNDARIDAYICTRDANVVNAIQDFFPGCHVVRDWEPDALLDDRGMFRKFAAENSEKYKTNAALVREFLNLGYKLTSEDIVDVLGITSKHAHRYIE